MQIQTPTPLEPKKGGMLDAIRQDKFIEFLTDEWPKDKEREQEDNANYYYSLTQQYAKDISARRA